MKILALLLLPFAFVSCQLATSTTPDEDSCNSGRATTSSEVIQLTGDNRNVYIKTTKPVDIYCHGIFNCLVRYNDSLVHKRTAPFPKVQINFGVDFVLGAPFPMDTIKHNLYDEDNDDSVFVWELKASQGAKNLSDDQDWHYDFSAYLSDTTHPVTVAGLKIDYKPKKQ